MHMSITLYLAFPEALSLLRRELAREGLETAAEWDSTLDLRDSVGPQLADSRCVFAFDPLALLHQSQALRPAAALATITLRASNRQTEITVEGSGVSYRKACRALARCRRQLPDLRHAA